MRAKTVRPPKPVRRRKAATSKKYVDWLNRPITKAQYERMKKRNK